jgi:hypothetical protein
MPRLPARWERRRLKAPFPRAHWEKLPKEQRTIVSMLVEFAGIKPEELRVRFAAKSLGEMMRALHEEVALRASQMPPQLLHRRLVAFAGMAEKKRIKPEQVVSFFLALRDMLEERPEQLAVLQSVHRMWAAGQEARRRPTQMAA